MPRGRVSSVPGLGILTRRTGAAGEVSARVVAKSSLSAGGRAFTPSTPAVAFPRLSCVTRRTANSLADHDFIKSLCSLRTISCAPRRWAR
jgi:hypothetical protein